MPVSKSSKYDSTNLRSFMGGLVRRTPNEPEFHQAVEEVASTVMPYIRKHDRLTRAIVLERMTEPDRVFMFRVIWEDDNGNVRLNRGYRVQFNNSLGPYKGGLRFHPSVNLSILKFLGFEQTFKNALTGLPLGAAKGGSDFNPRGKSDREILRFCKSFMLEIFRYIGPSIDVPAGDIGVGEREIGYLFGQYKRITGEFASGVLTGKGLAFGGSLIRREATGYGAAYFAEEMLNRKDDSLKGKDCLVSGSGNVAQYCAQKIIELGGRVLAMSDSEGTIYDKNGIDKEKLAFIMDLKNVKRGRIKEYATKYRTAKYSAGKRPWDIPAFAAFPCATQNEIELDDAKRLLRNKCQMVIEGANMPTTLEATALLHHKVMFAPAKAANAGGVAISGLEMSQNSLRLSWSEDEMQVRLRDIMRSIHEQCVQYGGKKGDIDYIAGANIAGFAKVSEAMLAHGV
ncbi:MAG: NADP-specific glutamate dehydrogenase [Gammaproteobacteria bacterium WSBS_2016_MAG_OTU1]